MENKFIKSAETTSEKYPLCGLDLVFGFHYVDTVCFLDKDYDIAVLEPALQEVINRIPVLAGKIVNENGRLVLDQNGPGVQFSYASANQPGPELDDLVFPISGYEFFNSIPQIFSSEISDMPLLSIKVTAFNNGIKCIGIRHNHAVMDGTSFHAFMKTWMACIDGAHSEPLIFSRDVVTSLAKCAIDLPSEHSGIPIIDGALAASSPIFFENQFYTLDITTEFKRLLELTQTRLKGIVSINHLMPALVFKAFGCSCKQDDSESARANQSYDIRWVKGAELPASFFGSAVLYRCLELNFSELRSIDLLSLALQFKQLAQPNKENMTQDMGFYQSQYEQRSYNKAGVYSNFSSVLANGGLYLNNLLRMSDAPTEVNFGGHLIRADIILPRVFGVRTAILMPTMQKKVLLRLALEKYQIKAFEKSWSALVTQLLEGQAFATA